MKKLLLVLGMVVSFSVQADWATAFEPSTQYAPAYSKQLTPDLKAVWFKALHPGNNSIVTLEQFNCKDKTWRLITYTGYLNGQADFKNSFDVGYINNPFKDVEPGTYLSKKMMFSCQFVH